MRCSVRRGIVEFYRHESITELVTQKIEALCG
jgi:hypothetical protein